MQQTSHDESEVLSDSTCVADCDRPGSTLSRPDFDALDIVESVGRPSGCGVAIGEDVAVIHSAIGGCCGQVEVVDQLDRALVRYRRSLSIDPDQCQIEFRSIVYDERVDETVTRIELA